MFPRSNLWWLAVLVLAAAVPGELGAAPRPLVRTDRLGDPLPPGAVARLGAVRLWHWASPTSLAFSADGKTLAAQTGNGDVILWDTSTGRRRYRLPTTGTVLTAISFLPDGSSLAVGDQGGQARLGTPPRGNRRDRSPWPAPMPIVSPVPPMANFSPSAWKPAGPESLPFGVGPR